jgi:hypothetical protein
MTQYVRVNLELPRHIGSALATYTASGDRDSRNQLMLALWNNKWTLESIARAAGGISRERVRQIIAATKPSLSSFEFEIPTPPMKSVRVKKQYTEPNPETLSRLLELQPFAQRVRSSSPAFRAESEEYSYLVNKAHVEEGVSVYRLAKRLGVTHAALQSRLVRYGYKPVSLTARSKVYNPIKAGNRIVK